MQTFMIKAKVISFLFMLLMTLQVLPLSSIGRMLCSNQWTEELPHHECGDEEGKMDQAKFSPVLPPVQYSFASHLITNKATLMVHISESIPSNHSNDVVSPPPDILA